MTAAADFLRRVDERRTQVNSELDSRMRADLRQFMTPASLAMTMAECVDVERSELHLLDPGAGIGSLTAAVVARVLDSLRRPEVVSLTAFEIDPKMRAGLAATLAECEAALRSVGVTALSRIVEGDFVEAALADTKPGTFTAAILNPPFMKISARSDQADRLRARGWSPANLYAAFWCAAVAQVAPGGDIVAVTPRSFCNGAYFAGFRGFLLAESALRCVHVFDARDKAFSEDGVLQETVVTHSVRGGASGPVRLALSHQPGHTAMERTVGLDSVVHDDDPASFIRLPVDEAGEAVREWMSALTHSLSDLGVSVSTGRVVDFRAREHLHQDYAPGLVPLLFPTHLSDGAIAWPKAGRKPNAFAPSGAEKLLTPDGHYAIVKRFSAKEERRRVVASYYDGTLGQTIANGTRAVALENHLNYLHMEGSPLPDWLARGLTMYLNSTHVDAYFREFNGHTQVNAGDLRSLRYPSAEQLRILGKAWEAGLSQAEIDAAVDSV